MMEPEAKINRLPPTRDSGAQQRLRIGSSVSELFPVPFL
jgi:hypothetical protein